jgi:hypothetical protein
MAVDVNPQWTLYKHELNINFPFLFLFFSYSNNGPSIEQVGHYELEEIMRKELKKIHLRPWAKHGVYCADFHKSIKFFEKSWTKFYRIRKKIRI